MKTYKFLASVALAASLFVTGCGTSSDIIPQPAQAQNGVGVVQVEQLARPAINEGLLVDNALLNAYNSVPPSFVRAALDNQNGPEFARALPLITDATATLNALLQANNNDGPFAAVNNGNGPDAGFFLGIFLPDVMRINTQLNFAPGAQAFGASFNGNFVLDSGRKTTDDVMDVVSTALTNNAAVRDNVPYTRQGGNQATGHSALPVGGNANPTFPFLAPAN